MIPLIFQIEVLLFHNSIQSSETTTKIEENDRLTKFPIKLVSNNTKELMNARKYERNIQLNHRDEKSNFNKVKSEPVLKFNFVLEKKYPIEEKSNEYVKPNADAEGLSEDSSLHDDSEIASELNFKMNSLNIYLSTECLDGIAKILDGFSESKSPKEPTMQSSEIQENLGYQEYENMMSCINNTILEPIETNVQ